MLGSLRNLANSDENQNIDFKRIKVVNIAQDLSEHQIDKLFRKFGKVEDIYLPMKEHQSDINLGFC